MDKEQMKRILQNMGIPEEVLNNVLGEDISIEERTQQLCGDSSTKKLLEMAEEIKENIEKAKKTAKDFNVALGIVYKELEKRKVKEDETGIKD